MITLSNGDKWIIDDSEWKEAGIEYEEACKGNIPSTDIKEFIEKLFSDESCLIPRKLTEMDGMGYWDANFDPFEEVLDESATRTKSNKWSDVYEMPWGEIIVKYTDIDSGGYDAVNCLERFKNKEEYNEAVLF